MIKCEHCKKENDNDANFCKYCGSNLKMKAIEISSKDCHECGYTIIGNPKFCTECGSRLKEKK